MYGTKPDARASDRSDGTSRYFKRRDFVIAGLQVRNHAFEVPSFVEASNVLTNDPSGFDSSITRSISGQSARSSSAPSLEPARGCAIRLAGKPPQTTSTGKPRRVGCRHKSALRPMLRQHAAAERFNLAEGDRLKPATRSNPSEKPPIPENRSRRRSFLKSTIGRRLPFVAASRPGGGKVFGHTESRGFVPVCHFIGSSVHLAGSVKVTP